MSGNLPNRPSEANELPAFLAFAVEHSYVDAPSAERAGAAMARSGEPVDVVLSELGLLNEARLAEAQGRFLAAPLAGPDDYPDTPIELPGVSPAFLHAAGLLPLAGSDEGLTVASTAPLDDEGRRALAFFLERPTAVKVALRSEFEAAFKRLYGDDAAATAQVGGLAADALDGDLERLKDLAREAPVIKLVNRLISDAVEAGASDIHLEPTEAGLRVRNRLDGALRTTEILPKSAVAGVVTRTKILAELNIAERRLPQDGRIRVALRGREVDLRVSTTPTLHGESVVLRILDRSAVALDFAALGFDAGQQRLIRELIAAPNGIVLVTGPTGSGKTTTLYSALLELNRDQAKIFTVEDPVEYQLAGINQLQVKPAIGLDFPAALRSILRQDPDIIMIGEIRDAETARIAVQSALTGHLVLSTLHTNSAAASVTRLLDMGIEDYLVASTVRGIVAQRLVRRVCRSCCGRAEVDAAMLARFGLEPTPDAAQAPVARGCQACQGTGYLGRTTIAEVLAIDKTIGSLILGGAPEAEIEAEMLRRRVASLQRSAIVKVLAGETTLDEAFRVTGGAA